MSSSNYRLQKFTLSFSECLGCGDSTSRIKWAGTEGKRPRPNSQPSSGAPVRTGPLLQGKGMLGSLDFASPANQLWV